MKTSHVLLLGLTYLAARPVLAQNIAPGTPPAVAARPTLVAAMPAPVRTERLKAELRSGVLRFAGSNPVGMQLVPELLMAYGAEARLRAAKEEQALTVEERTIVLQAAESNRALRGEIKGHGSASAFTELQTGKADIGTASRRIDVAEARTLLAARIGDMQRAGNENVVALDGIAFVVHRSNVVKALTPGQLRDILSGTITRWSEVGGPDLPVTVYGHEDKSGTLELIQQRIFGKPLGLAKTARLQESSEDLADAVASDPAAIGFVGIASARNAKPISIVSECGLPAAEPTSFQIKTEEYPLARRLYFYLADKHAPVAEDFVKYALSAAAQPAISRAGFIDLDPVLAATTASPVPAYAPKSPAGVSLPVPPSAAMREQALNTALSGARRLSVTIRFESGKSTVDSRGQVDLERLQQWMRQSGAGKAITLVGHSSSDGEFESNVALSLHRAQEVEARLKGLGTPPAAVLGAGPLAPVACDTSAESANLNRRVEVWIR